MDSSHLNSDTLAVRLLRKRREILFAIVLTFAAAGYTLAAHWHATQEEPVAMTATPDKVN